MNYAEKRPDVHPGAFIAETAVLIGDVTVAEGASVCYHATIRADRGPVRIGRNANVQDNAVIHMDHDLPVAIGERVTIGHSAIVHGAVVGDGSLVGMGAILMNGCRVGKHCLIGAGALVTQNMEIPDNSLVLGAPAKIVRQLTQEEIAHMEENADAYIAEAAAYRVGRFTRFRVPQQSE